MINYKKANLIFFLYFLGFFKAKNNAYLGTLEQTNLMQINDFDVFDKEQAEFDVDIQNPFIKDESIEFPKADNEKIIENTDYIDFTNNWSIFNTAQQELGDLDTFNWITHAAEETSIIY